MLVVFVTLNFIVGFAVYVGYWKPYILMKLIQRFAVTKRVTWMRETPTKNNKIALTVDDAPSNPRVTGEILKILKKYNVKATFFVIGSYGMEHESVLHDIVEFVCFASSCIFFSVARMCTSYR
jgi:peptidoglycan/xylan/chitin deacetylase (PgdA/CDA1 family)